MEPGVARYPHVFSEIQLGQVRLRNRFYFSPHSTPLSTPAAPSAVPSDVALHYYAERAAGGVGLVIQGGIPVVPAPSFRDSPYHEETIPAYAAVADAVHEHGARIFGQLAQIYTQSPQWGYLSLTKPTLGPTSFAHFHQPVATHAMSTEHIAAYMAAQGRSARNLRSAGYDGIEIHCSHGTLPETFLSPYWNRRTDGYGGTLEGRMRFLVELLQTSREAAGAELAVGIRLNCNEMLPGGLGPGDIAEILGILVQRQLLDFVDLDMAVEPNQLLWGLPPVFLGPRPYEPFVRAVRGAAGPVPVLSVLGRVTSIAEAEEAIVGGVVDAVGAARGLIAEPDLVRNALEGREDESRTCVTGNYCSTSYRRGEWACAINPASGRERTWGRGRLAPATQPSTVVVVGGGPAGLEASRVAARRGHRVVLFEREPVVGGQLVLWSALPQREVYAKLVDWYRRQLAALGVDVRTGREADAQAVLAEEPECVIVATGSRYARDGRSGYVNQELPGWEQDFVHTPEDVLRDGIELRGRVVLLDDEGLHCGAGMAEVLAALGAEVTYVTRHRGAAEHLSLTYEAGPIALRLEKLGVEVVAGTYVTAIAPQRVTTRTVLSGREAELAPVDAVVLVTSRTPSVELAEALAGGVPQLYAVGDALAPRGVADATHEGQRFARLAAEPGAPRTFAEAYFGDWPAQDFPRRAHEAIAVTKT